MESCKVCSNESWCGFFSLVAVNFIFEMTFGD